MSIATLNFVSVGFTLKVWRNWTRARALRLRNKLGIFQRMRQRRMYWVFGSARSGTTWLMEVLQRGYNLHSVFEPTHVHNPDFPDNDPDSNLRISSDLAELGIPEKWVVDTVSGRYVNASIDRSNPFFPIRKRDGVVLKDVDFRQLHISALTSLHPEIQPVIILRQPINTLKSQITAHKAWGHEYGFRAGQLKEFESLNKKILSADALVRLAKADALLKSLDYRMVSIARWCIENLVGLESQAHDPRLRVVLYEKMTAPESEATAYLEAIFGKFTHDPKLTRRSRMHINQPPSSTPEIERETAAMIKVFGLEAFTLPNQPHLLDLEKLVAEYQKPASDRLTPRFMR